MANERELSLKITGDSSKAEKAVANLEAALKKAERELDKAKESTAKVDDAVEGLGGTSGQAGGLMSMFGDTVGRTAKDKLGPFGDVADKLGLDLEGMGTKGLVAGAAVAGLGKFVADGVGKISEMTDEVRKFNDTSGVGWENSSRLVAISDDLGISADTAAAGMGRLAKNIDAGKLDEFGVSVVKAKDGTVDMTATLGAVADKMNATIDPTKKAAMGNALFGKSWADLQPLLQQGSAGIQSAMDGVKDYQIVTEKSAAEQRQMAMAIDDMQDAVSGLQMAMAKDLIPVITEFSSNAAKGLDYVNKFTTYVGGMKTALEGLPGPLQFQKDWDVVAKSYTDFTNMIDEALGIHHAKKAVTDLGTATKDFAVKAAEGAAAALAVGAAEEAAADKARILTARTKDLAEAAKDAAKQVKDQEAAVKALRDAVEGVVDTQLAYDASVSALNSSTDELTQKHLVMSAAVNDYGQDSKEAWAATRDYQLGIQAAESAAVANAKATVAMAEQQAAATGVAITAEQKNIIYRDSLNKVRDATTDQNLKDGLGGLIGLVDDTAAAAGRAEQKLLAANAAAALLAAAAKGITVIETGPAAGMVGGGSADSQERALTNQRATTTVINNNVTAYGADARDLGQLVNEQLINQRMERGG